MPSFREMLGLKPKPDSPPTTSTASAAGSGEQAATREQLTTLAAKAKLDPADSADFVSACVEQKVTLATASERIAEALSAKAEEAVKAADAAKNLAADNAGKLAAATAQAKAAKDAADAELAKLRDTNALLGDKGKGLSDGDAPAAGATLKPGNRGAGAFIKPQARGSVLDRFAPGLAARQALVVGTSAQGRADAESGKVGASDPRETLAAMNSGTLLKTSPAGPITGSAPETYLDAVAIYQQGGCTAGQAYRSAAVNYPKLHRAWLDEKTARAKAARRRGGADDDAE